MEIDLLKEPWPTMNLFDYTSAQKTPAADEENTVFTIWEENYQDLSGWCIDTFQGRCAFPIDEFETNKYSDTKSEDNGISIQKTGIVGKVSRGLEDSSLKVPELDRVEADTKSQTGDLQLSIKPEIIENRTIEMKDGPLLNPIDSLKNQETKDWIQLSSVDVPNAAAPITIEHESINHKTNNSNVISPDRMNTIYYEIAKNEKEDFDTMSTFDNTESESFDLLSYLCDDNIQSPDGSVVSRDSGPTIKSNSSITSNIDETSSSTVTTTMTTTTTTTTARRMTTKDPRRGRRNDIAQRDYAEANTSSSSSSIAAISAALDSVAKMSERTSRDREKWNSRSARNNYDASIGDSRGKKRCVDSDSEDRTSDGSYRESREKNNEASRKSRQNKKVKENEMARRASELERDNRILRMKVDELDKLVTTMRKAILRSALKKNS